MASGSFYTIRSEIIFRRIDEEMVLINLESDQIVSLNQTGAKFWELLADGNSLTEAREFLLDLYDVSEETLDSEILQMLRQWEALGFVQQSESQ